MAQLRVRRLPPEEIIFAYGIGKYSYYLLHSPHGPSVSA